MTSNFCLRIHDGRHNFKFSVCCRTYAQNCEYYDMGRRNLCEWISFGIRTNTKAIWTSNDMWMKWYDTIFFSAIGRSRKIILYLILEYVPWTIFQRIITISCHGHPDLQISNSTSFRHYGERTKELTESFADAAISSQRITSYLGYNFST